MFIQSWEIYKKKNTKKPHSYYMQYHNINTWDCTIFLVHEWVIAIFI